MKPGERSKNAGGVAQILKEAIEPSPAPGFAGLLAHAQRVAEVVAARARGHLAMEVHVVLELGVEAAAIDEITDAAE